MEDLAGGYFARDAGGSVSVGLDIRRVNALPRRGMPGRKRTFRLVSSLASLIFLSVDRTEAREPLQLSGCCPPLAFRINYFAFHRRSDRSGRRARDCIRSYPK